MAVATTDSSVSTYGSWAFHTSYRGVVGSYDRSRAVKIVRLKLAEHIYLRWKALGGNMDELRAVRLIRSTWRTGSGELSSPKGHWKTPPVTELPAKQRVLVGGYHSANGRIRPFWQEGDPTSSSTISVGLPSQVPVAKPERRLVEPTH